MDSNPNRVTGGYSADESCWLATRFTCLYVSLKSCLNQCPLNKCWGLTLALNWNNWNIKQLTCEKLSFVTLCVVNENMTKMHSHFCRVHFLYLIQTGNYDTFLENDSTSTQMIRERLISSLQCRNINHLLQKQRQITVLIYIIIIIIIIIKICSAHISTLLGAQGAETEKTWIQTFTVIAKTKLWDTCTIQLQIYIIFEKLWHKMSFKQRLKSSYTMTRLEFSWKMIPESRSRDRKRPITPIRLKTE